MSLTRTILVWGALAAAIAVPIAAAATSPLLAWRDPVYIIAGFAGVIAMALMLVQPLMAGGYLPGLSALAGRRIHRVTGAILVSMIVIHVAALWITSPPDVVDALLMASPTPFSIWGVVAMWAVFATALLAVLRKRLRLSPLTWRLGHIALAVVIVVTSIVHAMLIEGTMETISKVALSMMVLGVTIKLLVDLRARAIRRRRKS